MFSTNCGKLVKNFVFAHFFAVERFMQNFSVFFLSTQLLTFRFFTPV